MKTLIIVPCYNEQETILDLYREIVAKAPSCDILVVNDCSTDESLYILEEHGIPHLNLLMNLGIGGAMQAGYRYAYKHNYDIAVQVDGDGQHDPGWITELIAPVLLGKADIVIGSRFIDKRGFLSSTMRRAGIKFFKLLLFCISGKTITDATSGFRAANQDAIRLFCENYAKDFPEPESIMLALRNRLQITEIPVVMRERKGGVSSIRSAKSIYYMFKVSLGILLCAIQPRTI